MPTKTLACPPWQKRIKSGHIICTKCIKPRKMSRNSSQGAQVFEGCGWEAVYTHLLLRIASKKFKQCIMYPNARLKHIETHLVCNLFEVSASVSGKIATVKNLSRLLVQQRDVVWPEQLQHIRLQKQRMPRHRTRDPLKYIMNYDTFASRVSLSHSCHCLTPWESEITTPICPTVTSA